VPLLIILFLDRASSLILCASCVATAGVLDCLLFQLYKGSLRQQRKLISKCARLERTYALAKLALSTGHPKWAISILMKREASRSRGVRYVGKEARPKSSGSGPLEIALPQRPRTHDNATAVSASGATVFNIDTARTRFASKKAEAECSSNG
jgi:hypothetical protein